VIEALQDLDSDVKISALDCLKVVCDQGIVLHILKASFSQNFQDDVRTRFISLSGIEQLFEKIQDSDSDVQMSALDCLQVLCAEGIIFDNLSVIILTIS